MYKITKLHLKNMITLIIYYIINVININWNNFNDNTKLHPIWVGMLNILATY